MMRLALLGIAPEPLAPAGLAARLAPMDGARDRPAILAHHRQVVENAEAGPFLPAPFGIAFAHETAAEKALARHAPLLAERLASLGAGVEWLLRGPLAPVDENPASGRDFLRARARQQAEQRAGLASANGLIAAITGLGSPFVAQRQRPDGGIDLVFWMNRDWRRQALETAITLTDHPGWRLAGPWPAYASAGLAALFRGTEAQI